MTMRIYGRTYTASEGWVDYNHPLSADEERHVRDLAAEISDARGAARSRLQRDRRTLDACGEVAVQPRLGRIASDARILQRPIPGGTLLAAAQELYDIRRGSPAIGDRQIERVA